MDMIGTTTVLNPGPLHRGFYSIVELAERATAVFETLEKKG